MIIHRNWWKTIAKCWVANLKKEREQNFDLLTLDGSRCIYILIYPHIWGIVGCVIKMALVLLMSELTNNGHLKIYRQHSRVADFNSF